MVVRSLFSTPYVNHMFCTPDPNAEHAANRQGCVLSPAYQYAELSRPAPLMAVSALVILATAQPLICYIAEDDGLSNERKL